MNKEDFDKGETVALYGILALGIPAIIHLLIGFNLIQGHMVLAYTAIFISIVSYPVISYGCFFMAKGKGYHPVIGLLLSLILIGPVILSYMRYRK